MIRSSVSGIRKSPAIVDRLTVSNMKRARPFIVSVTVLLGRGSRAERVSQGWVTGHAVDITRSAYHENSINTHCGEREYVGDFPKNL